MNTIMKRKQIISQLRICILIFTLAACLYDGASAQDIFQLPFNEGWTSGTFTLNQWQVGSNWVIDGQVGNPKPAAKFKWDPVITNYSRALESWWIDDSSTNTTTFYSIWFDFDIKLSDRTSSGTEILRAEVLQDSTWIAVAEFVNDSSIDWTSKHISITNKVKDMAFKIRFTASGSASNEIYYWSVDNIHVYREFPLSPPRDFVAYLTASNGYVLNDMYLKWDPPAYSNIDPEWIHWDDGINSDAVGPNNPADFDIAARFDVSQIEQYEGKSVTRIAFWPNEAACQYSVRVWLGSMAANLLADQVVSNPTIGAWNDIELDIPLMIDVTQELWFGVRCNTTTGYPAGCDAGPQVTNYGQWIYWNGAWQNLVDMNSYLTFNWNLQAYLEAMDDASDNSAAPKIIAENRSLCSGILNSKSGHIATGQGIESLLKDAHQIEVPSDFLGYNIYRRYQIWPNGSTLTEWAKINDTPVTVTEYWDLNLPKYCYDYYVTAIYTEGESVPSNIDLYNYWCTTDIPDHDNFDAVVTPIPASDFLRIDDPVGIRSVLIYNSLGTGVLKQDFNGDRLVILDISNLPSGTYLLMLERINSESLIRKVLVVR
jgi:hypothetical protein